MTFRIGQCSSCGASYKLPATFKADQARCKNCSGVVNIGKVGEAAPEATAPPVPAAKPEEAAAPKKKRSGPSMKERIQAQRKAEAEGLAKGSSDAAPAKATAKPVKKAAAAATAAKPVSKPKPVQRTSSSRKKAAEGEAGDDKKSGRRRRAPAPKKKSPVAGIIGLVVIVGALGAAAFMMKKDSGTTDGDVKAADGNSTAATTDAEGGSDSPVGDVETAAAEPSLEDAEATAAADAKKEEEAAAKKEEAKVAKAAKKAEADKAMHDPSLTDLTEIEDFGPFRGTTADRFEELEELCAVMLDPEAGAAGNRAKNKLVEAGREAMPVIINAIKRLDLADEDQFRSADVSQKALQDICNGNNYGWKYPSQEPEKFHAFDKKVIKNWATSWSKCATDDAAWMKLAKLDAMPDAPEDEGGMDDEDDMFDF